MKECPFCAEEIQDAAIKCKHCGEWLEKEVQVPASQVVKAKERVSRCPKCGLINPSGAAKCDCGHIFKEIKKEIKAPAPQEVTSTEDDEITKINLESGKKQCPTCGKWDVYRAVTEDNGQGDWCPNCNKSIHQDKLIINKNNKYYEYLWPKIWDVVTAKTAMLNGLYLIGWIVIINIINTILKLYGKQFYGSASFADGLSECIVWASIGFGIYYYSRIAALIGFCLYIYEKIDMIFNNVSAVTPAFILISLLFIDVLFHTARGSFKYHTLLKTRIMKKNIVIKIMLTIVYSVLSLGLLYLILIILSMYMNMPITEKLIEFYIIIIIVTMYCFTFNEIFPFTKNKPIIIYKSIDGRETEAIL